MMKGLRLLLFLVLAGSLFAQTDYCVYQHAGCGPGAGPNNSTYAITAYTTGAQPINEVGYFGGNACTAFTNQYSAYQLGTNDSGSTWSAGVCTPGPYGVESRQVAAQAWIQATTNRQIGTYHGKPVYYQPAACATAGLRCVAGYALGWVETNIIGSAFSGIYCGVSAYANLWVLPTGSLPSYSVRLFQWNYCDGTQAEAIVSPYQGDGSSAPNVPFGTMILLPCS